jgi:cytochrome d ubiquinol oxidase subunit I
MDVVLLARVQFAFTIGFHFIFPAISIGLFWFLVWLEWRGWRKADADCLSAALFFQKLAALIFALGVATGIVMEFQFGMNWAHYSKFVGDIFGAPLAAEGLFAFFLESVFLGLYLFGRNRVSKAMHWWSCFLVSLGATISAFWIIVANSWQQTPAGYAINELTGRAELINFWAAVFNPSTLPRYFHTVLSCMACGAFFVVGICAWYIWHNRSSELFRRVQGYALIMAFISSILVAFPFGDWHAKQVAKTQPEKFAAMEGVINGRKGAPLVAFGIPRSNPPRIDYALEIPYLGSLLAFNDPEAHVPGYLDFPADEVPPLVPTFLSFHLMVQLGVFFILVSGLGLFFHYKNKIPLFLHKIYFFIIPLPIIATQAGWITAEVGRQPWVVYKMLRTVDAVSSVVKPMEIIFSLFLFAMIYLLLFMLWMVVMRRIIAKGPELMQNPEVS